MKTLSEVCKEVTLEYLKKIDIQSPPTISTIRHQLMDKYIEASEILRIKSPIKIPQIREIPNAEIARLLVALHNVVRVHFNEGSSDDDLVLMVYVTEGRNKGIYSSQIEYIHKLIREYYPGAKSSDCKEVIHVLNTITETKHFNQNRDLIGVANGIFNYKTKKLSDFTPDIILKSKSHVKYNPAAYNAPILNPDDGTIWDVESWFNELSDDPEIVELLWQVVGASIRPNTSFNKAIFMYSEVGNNGKGSLCSLMNNLCGAESTYSLSIEDFDKEFMLEPLLRASLVIGDENNFGYIDKSAKFKAACTGDVLHINRKNKIPITARYKGLIVECLNEYPRVKDKSPSFYRRILAIPFDKCFTGVERKYIKDDYLKRSSVLEYILYRVLHMDYYEFSEPESCKLLKNDLQTSNDPLLQFAEDVFPNLTWNLVPYVFLYELYIAWMSKYNQEGKPMGRNKFTRDIKNMLSGSTCWECVDNYGFNTYNSGIPEPMILEYNLTSWKRAGYKGSDADLICTPDLDNSMKYRGLLKK